MVRVVVNGVGKLGQAIVDAVKETCSDGSNVTVVAGVDKNCEVTCEVPVYSCLTQVEENFDLIIDGSRAEGLDKVLGFAVAQRKALIVASTGHCENQLSELKKASHLIPILVAANLSVGVNVIRFLTQKVGEMLGPVDAEVVETHHRMKVDAPSGTAHMLAQTLRDATDSARKFVYGRTPQDVGQRGTEIGVHALRGGTVVGEHVVRFLLDDEILELRHVAQSRKVFGFGALRAATFLASQGPGFYTMENLLE